MTAHLDVVQEDQLSVIGNQERQSIEANQDRRPQLVWEIDRKLRQDAVRPIVAHTRWATCWQPGVKGLTIMSDSSYKGWRMEDVWLDK